MKHHKPIKCLSVIFLVCYLNTNQIRVIDSNRNINRILRTFRLKKKLKIFQSYRDVKKTIIDKYISKI